MRYAYMHPLMVYKRPIKSQKGQIYFLKIITKIVFLDYSVSCKGLVFY